VVCESILKSWLQQSFFNILSCFIRGFLIQFEMENDIYENRVYWAYTWPWMKDEVRKCWGGSTDLVGGRATWPRPGSGSASSCVVLSSFLSKFCDFCDCILSFCHCASPPHLFPIFLHAQQGGDKNTYPEKIESDGNQLPLIIIRHFINQTNLTIF
jgi:hypothetical protein